MFLIGATDMGGTPSDGAGGKTINLLWKRGGQLRIFRSGMSCLAKASLFPVLSCFFTLAHRRALLLWHRCHSVSSFISPLPFLPLLLSDFQYLSILFSSAAFFKVSPNNFYFASLFMFTWTVLWFNVFVQWQTKFQIFLLFLWLSVGMVVVSG